MFVHGLFTSARVLSLRGDSMALQYCLMTYLTVVIVGFCTVITTKHLLPVLATTLSCRFERLNKSMSYLPCALSAASIVSLVWTAIYIQAILRALLNQRKNVYCRIPEYACIPGVDPRYHCSSNQTLLPREILQAIFTAVVWVWEWD